ncbi:MAG: hypothetical protein IJK89_07370 [Clostridia bacterium]|nr:hypothetical protein [Clostridia bacterium]
MKEKQIGIQTEQRKKSLSVIITAAGLMAIAGACVYCFFRASRGICSSEEACFVSIPFRFVLGDHIAADEWHVTQLAALFQLLPVKLFMTATSSTEGIILFLRYFYVVCLAASALFLILLLPKENRRVGMVYAFFLCAYIPYIALDLNHLTVYILSFCLVGVLLFPQEDPGKIRLFFAGALWAISVLAQPYTALTFFIYSAVVLYYFLFRRRTTGSSPNGTEIFRPTFWASVAAGILIVVFGFLFVLLKDSDISKIFASIPYILSDPEHPLFLHDLPSFFEVLCETYTIPIMLIDFLCLLMVIFCRVRQSQRKRHTEICIVISATVFCVSEIVFYGKSLSASGVQYFPLLFREYPFILFGVECLLLTKKKDPRLKCWFAAGIVNSALIDCSVDSSAGLGECVTVLPAMLAVSDLFHELKDDRSDCKYKKHRKIITTAICGILASACVFTAYRFVYILYFDKHTIPEMILSGKEAGFSVCDTEIETGPLKGIYTVPEIAKDYYRICSDLDIMKDDGQGLVYVMDNNALCYLYLEREIPISSTWYIPDYLDRECYYLSMHPEKQPAYIYITYDSLLSGIDFEDDFNIENDKRLAWVKEHYVFETREADAGLICRILSVKESTFGLERPGG